jgi:DNA-binding transcriptional LysR family regulator
MTTSCQRTHPAHGSELLAITQPSLRTLNAAISRIEEAAKGRTKWISVGTTPWVAAHVLPPAIKEFREHRPDLRIRLFDAGLGRAFLNFRSALLRVSDQRNVTSHRYFQIEIGLRVYSLGRICLIADEGQVLLLPS